MKKIYLCIFCIGFLTSQILAQGPLTPPGTPMPSMKTLDQIDSAITNVSNAVEQVEARIDLATVIGNGSYHHVISLPGSYYLSENIGVTKTSGIMVESANVTIDLNGFNISRLSGNGGYGIYIAGGMDRATVRNGSIIGFDYGIRCWNASYAKGCLFEDLAVSGCLSYGIHAGTGARVIDCRTHDNAGTGIYCSDGASIEGCISADNQGNGIFAENTTVIGSSTVYGNNGIFGIRAGNGSVISDCSAQSNKVTYAIYATQGSTVSRCSVYGNDNITSGILAGIGSTIVNCSAISNMGNGIQCVGIWADSGSIVAQCSANNNGTAVSQPTNLQGTGIYAADGTTVKDCTTYGNKGDGIRVYKNSFVVGNNSYGNGEGEDGDGAGIHAAGDSNRIEDNTVTDNDRGIDVDGVGNLVIRTSARGNGSNYEAAAMNKLGAIVIPTANATPISGDTGGTVGPSNPWANLSF